MKKYLFLLGLFLYSCGLTTVRPKDSMSLSQVAFLAAQDVNGQALAPKWYRKAEFYYLRAKAAYRRKSFNKAKQYADLSRRYSEHAEFVALRKKTLQSLEKNK